MIDNLSVSIQGLDKINKDFANYPDELESEVNAALLSIAKKIEGDAKASIQRGPKTGKFYKRRGVTHRASAPGQAPASNTGRLANSIIGKMKGRLHAEISATTHYARFLEFGTRFIKRRPFMAPALMKNKDFIEKRITIAIKKALKK